MVSQCLARMGPGMLKSLLTRNPTKVEGSNPSQTQMGCLHQEHVKYANSWGESNPLPLEVTGFLEKIGSISVTGGGSLIEQLNALLGAGKGKSRVFKTL